MVDYVHYQIEDFIGDEAFRRWVLKPTVADTIFWENWLQTHPQRADRIWTARQLIEAMQEAQENLSDRDFEQQVNRITEARLSRKAEHLPTQPQFWKKIRVAAAVVLVAGMGSLFYYVYQPALKNNQVEATKTTELRTITNRTSSPQLLTLMDGSQVKLEPGSQVRFPKTFDEKQRNVYLEGEAFFEVTRNPEQPFVVYAHQLVAKVLGTSFTIRSFEKNVQVMVRTGKVAVFTRTSQQKAKPVILTPNQQVVFTEKKPELKRTLVEAPQPTPEALGQTLSFDRTPLPQVFDQLQKTYLIPITYNRTVFSDCQLTAELGQEPLFEKLDMICRTVNAHYTIRDGQIFIQGKKCQ
ncbi:iron dicitrate transport regulator FecR [Siphonobacter sp. BAB-5405]|uniref:FecR family protein n=1 Tax=Siphonobacter sp. BAB-5405 TaxID=1864825 RepID=UPI000C8067ED|nr:FecR family protein [Siphonobacter sp. BAB-5405]PMD98598.1 iron dicitrate transport regulator FecR [Siphonobacter sp. BAB-5405]